MSIVAGKLYVCDKCGKEKFVVPSDIKGTQSSPKHHYVKYIGIDYATVDESYCFCKECLDKYLIAKNKFFEDADDGVIGSI